jgi:chaperone protein EcpD
MSIALASLRRIACAFALALLALSTAHAGMVINGTRVIYPAEEREVTVSMKNDGTSPRLIQVWVDDGDPKQAPDTSKAPFLVTPPMSRVDVAKSQTIRLMFTGADVPQDRESVYWLNVLEVPPKPKATNGSETPNYLQFAIRSRLKIFYRPKGLPGSPMTAVQQLQWKLVPRGDGYEAECTNPTAYNVSLGSVSLKGVDVEKTMEPKGGMCPAKGAQGFPVKGNVASAGGKLSLQWINDFGGFEPYEAGFTQ